MLKNAIAKALVASVLTASCACCPHRVNGSLQTRVLSQPQCDLPPSALLPLQRLPQERSQLCWAASGQATMKLLGVEVSQCTQLNRALPAGSAACPCETCPASRSLPIGVCNNGGWPNFAAFGFSATRIHGALRLDELKREIACRGSAVAFSWKTDVNSPDSGGHMMVVYGYTDDLLVVMDPEPVCSSGADAILMTYDEYLNGDGPLSGHWDDFYAIEKKPQ